MAVFVMEHKMTVNIKVIQRMVAYACGDTLVSDALKDIYAATIYLETHKVLIFQLIIFNFLFYPWKMPKCARKRKKKENKKPKFEQI